MKKKLLCLVFAALTGFAFHTLSIPHGLLLGSMVGSAAIAISLDHAINLKFGIEYVQVVLGTATGLLMSNWNGFMTPHIVPSIVLMLICLLGQYLVSWVWLCKICKWDQKDAVLATYPGALAAVLDLVRSENTGNRVVVVHLTRLVLITCTLSLMIPSITNQPDITQPFTLQSHAKGLAILLTLCILTGLIMRRLAVPAPFMISAILLTSFLASPLELNAFTVPDWCLDVTTIILGVIIGSKVKGMKISEISKHAGAGLVSVSLMLLFAAAVALIFANVVGVPPLQLWLAHLPGAIELVALIGYSNGLNVAFILLHHLVRMIVLHFTPAILAQSRNYRTRPKR